MLPRLRLCHLMLLLCFSLSTPANATLDVSIPLPANLSADDNRYYYVQLLTLALEKTRNNYGDFRILYKGFISAGPERERAMLTAKAGLDIVWGSNTPERENSMLAIPFDIMKNLNSYRILIIKDNNQDMFNDIKNITDFRRLKAGSGINWSQNKALDANAITIISSGSFQGLYKMLAAERFDYVPRAPYEVRDEISVFGNYGISIEQHLLLKFSAPNSYCFFVHKTNSILAERITAGLKQAQADGSFDALFLSYPNLRDGLSLTSQARTLIALNANTHE